MGEPEKDKKCCDSHKMNDLIGSDHVMSVINHGPHKNRH